MSRRQSEAKQGEITLAKFMRAKAKQGCLVCKLAPGVREQLGPSATRKGFTRDDQIEWLKAIGARGITHEVLANHFNGRHDRED